MKKLVVTICTLVFVGSTFAVAASNSTGKILNSKLVQGPAVVTVARTQVSVPQGQTVIVGHRENGSIVIRGLNLSDVKIDGSSVYTKGYTALSYEPSSRVAFLNKGEELTLIDRDGNSATVEQAGAISTNNALVNSNTVNELKEAAKAEAAKAEAAAAVEEGGVSEENAVPAFVASTAASPEAVEQSVQNVEDTLSPSAPRS